MKKKIIILSKENFMIYECMYAYGFHLLVKANLTLRIGDMQAEVLLVEQIKSSCYELIENFCSIISNNLTLMLKQR